MVSEQVRLVHGLMAAHRDLEEWVGVLEQLVEASAHDAGSLSEQGELHVFQMKELSQLVTDNQKDNVD